MTGDDKGKQGYVCFIVQERNWVLVEGLNCEYKQDGESGLYPGFMTKKEKPLLVTTDIKLVDPSDEQSCDVEWQFSEDGERVRISTRTGYHLPIPTQADETVDYKAKTNYSENKEKFCIIRISLYHMIGCVGFVFRYQFIIEVTKEKR